MNTRLCHSERSAAQRGIACVLLALASSALAQDASAPVAVPDTAPGYSAYRTGTAGDVHNEPAFRYFRRAGFGSGVTACGSNPI